MKGPITTEHETLCFEWLTSKHFVFLWITTYNCPSKQISILILTDNVIINIIDIIHRILGIKSKHDKWNVSREAAAHRCSPK